MISTPLRLGDREWPIELTLTRRDSMRFRMLLGRSAFGPDIAVQPNASYLAGRPPSPRRLRAPVLRR